MHRSNRLVRLVTILVLGGLGLGVCFVALAPGVERIAASAQYSGKVGPQLRALEDPTTLYDMNGAAYDRLGDLDRQPVALAAVPKMMRQAVISTEDRTFYSNDGIDVKSAVRALMSNVGAGGIDQGGSTITQQLIKNRFFKNPKRNLDRKVREAILAHRLTNEWSKNRILEEYLNTVYFGENSYGIQAASTRIIGKPNLADLTLSDAALLAGLIKNPTSYDIFVHQNEALQRRNEVIRRMRVQHVITEAQAVFARTAPLPPSLRPTNALQATTPYGEQALKQLKSLPELGKDEAQRTQLIFSGGLRVFTEYDPHLTQVAVDSIRSVAKPSFAPFRAGMAVMDPRTGAVRAVVGTKDDLPQSNTPQSINLATRARQVGSTFKAITLSTAFENLYSPKDTVDGSSSTDVDPATGKTGCKIVYSPSPKQPPIVYYAKNSSEGEGGVADLYQQTANSVNCAFLRLLTSIGQPKVRKMATDMGYTNPVGDNIAMGVGIGNEHSPLEQATVYGTIANDGVRHLPVFVRRVEDVSGRVLYRAPAGVRVLQPETARTVTDVLTHVITEGTGTKARLADRPAAGKTGTIDNQVDAWFAGYTPQLVAAVWMGNPATDNIENKAAWMKSVGGVTVFGGTYPAMIWQKFMTEALKGQPVIQFIKPDETLWPSPARVNPKGGRDVTADFGPPTSSTSITLPTDSTSSSSTSSSSTSSSSTTSTTKSHP